MTASQPAVEPPEAVAPRIETRPLRTTERLRQLLIPRQRGYQLALLAALLAGWEIVGRQTSNFTFAPPSRIVAAAEDLVASGELQDALTDSVVALLLGFGLAAVVGIGVGFAMGWWRVLGRTLDPFVGALYVVPIAALVPIIIVWAGLGVVARVVVIFLFALFDILLNAYGGVRNADPYVVDVARTFGATRLDLVRKVVLPAALPFVFVGLRIGAGRAVKGMVLAEMLFSATGLGRLIIKYAQAFRMDRVLVAVIVIALVGLLTAMLVQAAERRVLRWRD